MIWETIRQFDQANRKDTKSGDLFLSYIESVEAWYLSRATSVNMDYVDEGLWNCRYRRVSVEADWTDGMVFVRGETAWNLTQLSRQRLLPPELCVAIQEKLNDA